MSSGLPCCRAARLTNQKLSTKLLVRAAHVVAGSGWAVEISGGDDHAQARPRARGVLHRRREARSRDPLTALAMAEFAGHAAYRPTLSTS